MEEVVDATGAGIKKGRAALPGTNSEIQQEQQEEEQSYLFSASSGNLSFKAKTVTANRDCRPNRALPCPAECLPSTDIRSSAGAAVNDMFHTGALSEQSNHSSRCLILDQQREQLSLENVIGVSVESDCKVSDSCSGSCSSTSVGMSQMGQPELLGRCPTIARRALQRGAHRRRGNMIMQRGRGLARAVLCKLEKADASAQAGQASMQVFLKLS